jgi:polyisoprenoid-binding protein YceI
MSTETASGTSTAPDVVRFRIDAARSRFTVRAFAGGMLSALGHHPNISIREFSGEARFVPGTLDSASLRMVIKPDSLTVADDVSAKDRQEIEKKMLEEVLEISRYPEITYESTTITSNKNFGAQYRVTINGKLTLHGVTRDHSVTAQVIVSEDRIRANGEFTLRQTDYGIKLVSAAGGTIKLKDELKFSFDIVANREASES